MRTRGVLLAAGVAGVLGVAAGVAVDPARFAGSRLAALLDPAAPAPADSVAVVPALALVDPGGTRRELEALIAGRPALINLWATWCAPCLEEMPALDAFARAEGARGMQVIGIALDDADAVRAFLRQRPVGYPILVDAPGPADAAMRLGNTRGVLPYSLLVDADGRILRRWAGPLEPQDLKALAAEARPTRD